MHRSMPVFWVTIVGLAGCAHAAPGVATTHVCQVQGEQASGFSQLQSGMRAGVSPLSIQPGRDPAAGTAAALIFATTTALGRDDSSRTVELDGSLASLAGTRLLRAYARLVVALRAMDKHAGPSAAELEDAIAQLVEDQGSAPVACSGRMERAAAKLKRFTWEIRATVGELRKSKKVVLVADTELKSTLQTLKVLGDKQAEAVAACDDKTDMDQQMLTKLQADMQSMRSIRAGDENKSPALLELSQLLPTDATERPASSGPTRSGDAQQLLAKTQAASIAMRACLQHGPKAEDVSLLSHAKPTDCASERVRLKQSFQQAYGALTREVATYQELAADKSCVHSVESDYAGKFDPPRQMEKELSSRVADAMGKVKMLRPKLKTLRSTQEELNKRLEALSFECISLHKTKKSLGDTEEIIKEMEGCADLDPSAFKLPVWVGKWITAALDEDQEIHEVDAAMTSACAESFGAGARPAEVSEIDTGSILKMPKYNCALAPFLPACPLCGTDFARVCWDSGARLDHYERRTDCSAGTRAVLCVSETGDDYL